MTHSDQRLFIYFFSSLIHSFIQPIFIVKLLHAKYRRNKHSSDFKSLTVHLVTEIWTNSRDAVWSLRWVFTKLWECRQKLTQSRELGRFYTHMHTCILTHAHKDAKDQCGEKSLTLYPISTNHGWLYYLWISLNPSKAENDRTMSKEGKLLRMSPVLGWRGWAIWFPSSY